MQNFLKKDEVDMEFNKNSGEEEFTAEELKLFYDNQRILEMDYQDRDEKSSSFQPSEGITKHLKDVIINSVLETKILFFRWSTLLRGIATLSFTRIC